MPQTKFTDAEKAEILKALVREMHTLYAAEITTEESASAEALIDEQIKNA